jgi:hypothetical protein
MIGLFVIKLATGICLMWLLMPRKEVTDGFFRIQMRVVLGLTVLAALLLTTEGTWDFSSGNAGAAVAAAGSAVDSVASDAADSAADGLPDSAAVTAGRIRSVQIAMAVVAYAGSVFWALGRRLPGNLCIYILNLGCLSGLLLHSWSVPNAGGVWMQILADLSSAAVLGSVITGMLLGHWYLTTPSMSIQPLWWFGKAIIVAAVARLAASAWCIAEAGLPLQDTSHWIWLALRWIGGIVVPLVVAFLVFRILRYRNTQSATGVLFAGLIVVFMGEMTAALLERDVLLPY